MTLPEWLLTWLNGGAVSVDGETLDPALVMVGRRAGRRLHQMTPDEARAEMLRAQRLTPTASALMDRIEQVSIPVLGGEIEGRLYTPADLRPGPPLLVFFHGGGWVIGDLETHDDLCRLIAGQTPCKVLSVHYRLAPEHRFPTPVEDAVSAFRFAVDNASQLGVDGARVAVGGDSAGGNLAAAVAQLLSGESARPCGQLLIYPVTSARRDTRSYELFAQDFGLSRAAMDWFFAHYLDDEHDSEDPRISPLEAEDFSALPPTVIALASFDVLRDEGVAYAERLQEAGVETALLRFPLIHSFARLAGLPACRHALDQTISELAGLFHRAR